MAAKAKKTATMGLEVDERDVQLLRNVVRGAVQQLQKELVKLRAMEGAVTRLERAQSAIDLVKDKPGVLRLSREDFQAVGEVVAAQPYRAVAETANKLQGMLGGGA